MDFELTDEHKMFREAIRNFGPKRGCPRYGRGGGNGCLSEAAL